MPIAREEATTSADGGQPSAGEGELPAVQMTRMLTGFELSQALYAVAKHDVATAMAEGPRPVEEIAGATGTHVDALRRVLRSLTGAGVVTQERTDVFGLTTLGRTLAGGDPDSVRDYAITLMETHYAAFGQFAETVRTGVPAATLHYEQPFMDWMSADADRADNFTAGMAAVTKGLQAGVFEGYELPAGDVVADLGGADGSVLTWLLRHDAGRKGVVFDLPQVVPAAKTRIQREGFADRVEAVSGDFFEGVPTADVYLLSTVLHDWDDDACIAILRQAASAARPGARLVVVEIVLPPGDEPHFGKHFDLTMLGMVTGRERTEQEFTELFRTAGLRLTA